MRRSVFSVIGGIIFSFLVLLLAFYVFIISGVTPIGKDIRLVIKHQSFDKLVKAVSPEEFLQLQEQAFQFTVLFLFPVVCLLTGLIAGSISRRHFWLVGLLSVTPFTILSIIMEADILTIPLTILYLGLGSLGGFIAGYFKKKKMKLES
jgi:hypothetical protein